MKVIGQLEKAALENLASASPTPTPTGRMYMDVTAPTAGVMKVWDGSAWKTVQYQSSTGVVNPTNYAALENLGLATSVASSAMTVALKQVDGITDPTAASPVRVNFRVQTTGVGGFSRVDVTSAISMAITSGATLGLQSAINQYIHVYAINNAGVLELAVAGSRAFDEGAVQSTTVMSSGSDSSNVLYSTTARTNVSIRYLGRILSNQATSGTYATNSTQVSINPNNENVFIPSQLVLNTGVGFGSSSSNIRRLSTIESSIGTDISYPGDSATLGAVITIVTDGVYAVTYDDQDSAASLSIGISVNSNQLTTGIASITAANRLGYQTVASGIHGHFSTTRYFKAGDVIRPHVGGGTTPDTTSIVKFSICKVSY